MHHHSDKSSASPKRAASRGLQRVWTFVNKLVQQPQSGSQEPRDLLQPPEAAVLQRLLQAVGVPVVRVASGRYRRLK